MGYFFELKIHPTIADAIINKKVLDGSLRPAADNFIAWLNEGFWTARGEVFDIGISTQEAISRLMSGQKPELAGGFDEFSNGNGSHTGLRLCLRPKSCFRACGSVDFKELNEIKNPHSCSYIRNYSRWG